MIKLRKFESCRGLSFPSIGKWKIEIWYAPSGYTIREHTHNNEDIKLVLLFGHDVVFHRVRNTKYSSRKISFLAKLWHIGKSFSIRAGDSHWFEVSRFPLVFLNIERWHTKPTSACEDLQFTTER